MWRALCAVPFLLLQTTQAQELVINGGFEEYGRCPDRFNRDPARTVEGLKTVGGMPGYFHACSDMMGTPVNWAGVQAPLEGEAYVGLVLTAHGGNECGIREFVQLELAEPLVNGGKYLLSFHVSLADRTGYTTDRIGASFSMTDRTRKESVSVAFGKPDVDNAPNRFIADTSVWMKVEGIYNARGGERYVQIGNFQFCDRTSRKALSPDHGAGKLRGMKRKLEADIDPDHERGLRRRLLATQAYVFVDAVSLLPLGSTTGTPVLQAKDACAEDPGRPSEVDDLVPDPGFDSTIPTSRSAWRNASGGTPDFEVGRTGIYLYSAVNKDHREYITTPLEQRLDPCGVYDVRLRVMRNATYGHLVDRIGVAITEEFENDRRRGLLSFPLRWELHGKGVMDDTQAWTTLCGSFDGGGCANRLLVGNFSSDDSTTIVQREADGGPFAYYFVDDVSLWRTGTVEGCTTTCPEAIAALPLTPDTTVDMPRWPLVLHFEVNDPVPGDDLLPVVEELFVQLAKLPTLIVTVAGHTDASGNEYANMKLAKRRALAVRSELVRLGLPASRIRLEVHGSEQPVATNSTETGRALNRRVEIAPRSMGN